MSDAPRGGDEKYSQTWLTTDISIENPKNVPGKRILNPPWVVFVGPSWRKNVSGGVGSGIAGAFRRVGSYAAAPV